MMLSTDDLRGKGLSELEAIYQRTGAAAQGPPTLPRGRFVGHFLRWLENDGARHPLWRPGVALMFQLTPFGVDFNEQRWFFFGLPALAAGRFTPRVERSRWRGTDAVCLHYDASLLPGPVKGLLYDEVQPLNDAICLGLGGINAPRGRGDMFFFALECVAP
jgi:hypothetical protein